MADLITLSPPDHRLPRELFYAPGGFVWWYLDLVDADGNGVVVIWSWGLPFLPGYARATRRGMAQLPINRPSLNICVYRNGELDFYALQEFAREDATWEDDDERWRFGASTLESRVIDGRRKVRLSLDCEVPGSTDRLVGTIALDGVARHGMDGETSSLDHDWSPLMGPATGEVDLRAGTRTWNFEGRAYHDRNGGRIPMHDIAFDYWLWGRIPFEDRELIYYLLWPRDGGEPITLGLEIDADGKTALVRDLEIELSGQRRSLPGLKWWQRITLRRNGRVWVELDHVDVVDDGPFYMRYQTVGTLRSDLGGESPSLPPARGFGEYVVPENIDLDIHRPLVQMRVQKPAGERNSMWLPLFTGPKNGRVTRLVKNWFGSEAPL